MSRFSTVLVANRGEIACRVIRSIKEAGYRAVAVFSDADEDALHARSADLAVHIGPSEATKSYLSIPAIIEACKRSGADALHPGYGFLSENAELARACAAAGIVFIGPSAEAIASMGNKAASKRRMVEAKVPTIPGYEGEDQSDAAFEAAASRVGFPLLVKASAGGGGRGMRLVRSKAELVEAVRAARAEAQNAFGNGELLLERALLEARHVEIQILGDEHGNVLHLGERDCSIQRRHQKVVEESPSPAVSKELRAKMGASAVAAAKSIDYVGAGTVEFLLDADGSYYFLEMNTRLQVEHPVTELVTGRDLVALQLLVAEGEPLPFAQEEVALVGHAIEVRLYAEDPYEGFLPCTGTIARFIPGIEGSENGAVEHGKRIDHGLREGQQVSSWYDPMLAKLVAHGRDREEARRRLLRLLDDTVLLGTTTNKSFLTDILSHPGFAEGRATTSFLEKNFSVDGVLKPTPKQTPPWLRAAAAVLLSKRDGESKNAGRIFPSFEPRSWALRIVERGKPSDLRVSARGTDISVREGAEDLALRILPSEEDELRFLVDGIVRSLRYAKIADTVQIDSEGRSTSFEEVATFRTIREAARGDGRILAPMNGRILEVATKVGDEVRADTVLLVLEAMKMQHRVLAGVDGVVREVLVVESDQVSPKKLLVSIEPKKGEAEA